MEALKKCVLHSVLIGCVSIFPLSAFGQAGWRGEGKVLEVSVNYYNDGFGVRFENQSSMNSCASSDVIVVHRSLTGFDDAYSLALTAFATGKPLDVWVNGDCFANYNTGVGFVVKQ